MDNSQFFWNGSIFCCSPCPQLPGLYKFYLSFQRAKSVAFQNVNDYYNRLLIIITICIWPMTILVLKIKTNSSLFSRFGLLWRLQLWEFVDNV